MTDQTTGKSIRVVKSDMFSWDPQRREIAVDPERIQSDDGRLQMLHEVSHALLGHQGFADDVDRKSGEEEAWRLARSLGEYLGLKPSMPAGSSLN